MKVACLSDTHLGFRHGAATIKGRNAREVDTERAWFAAIEAIDEWGADLVTIAGDLVHHPRVGMHAVMAYRDGVRKLVDAGIYVVIVGGNHDFGRSTEVLTPIVVSNDYAGAHVVTEPGSVHLGFPEGKVNVACFPFVELSDGAPVRLAPDPSARFNLLVMHAEVKGSDEGDKLPYFYGGAGALDVGGAAEEWDLIHCGDYHEFTKLHPTKPAFYSGSLERTSTNIWDETAPKGWVAADLVAGTYELRTVATRAVFDFDFEDYACDEPSASALNGVLGIIADDPDYADTIGRLKVDGMPSHERELVDWALVRKLKESFQHFQIDIQYVRDEGGSVHGEDGHTEGLGNQIEAFLADDEPAVRELVMGFLDDAMEVA